MRSRWRCVHLVCFPTHRKGFPDSSVGKEFTCNAGDPGSIPGSGRSGREGTSYPLQYSWVSLVAQLVKNLPAMRETWVRSLGWEDPMEKGTATPPVFWPGESHGQSMGLQRVGHNWMTLTLTFLLTEWHVEGDFQWGRQVQKHALCLTLSLLLKQVVNPLVIYKGNNLQLQFTLGFKMYPSVRR